MLPDCRERGCRVCGGGRRWRQILWRGWKLKKACGAALILLGVLVLFVCTPAWFIGFVLSCMLVGIGSALFMQRR